jgi:hypothetical protein
MPNTGPAPTRGRGGAMKNLHLCRNYYGNKVEYCLLVEKGAGAIILALVTVAIAGILAGYFLI